MRKILSALFVLSLMSAFPASIHAMGKPAPKNTWVCYLPAGERCSWQTATCIPNEIGCRDRQEYKCDKTYHYSEYTTTRAEADKQARAVCLKDSQDPGRYCHAQPTCRFND